MNKHKKAAGCREHVFSFLHGVTALPRLTEFRAHNTVGRAMSAPRVVHVLACVLFAGLASAMLSPGQTYPANIPEAVVSLPITLPIYPTSPEYSSLVVLVWLITDCEVFLTASAVRAKHHHHNNRSRLIPPQSLALVARR